MGFEACQRTGVEEDLRRRNARLDLLAEGARQLLSDDAPEAIVQALCEKVMAHLDCQVFAGFISDPGQSRMELKAHAGMPKAALEAIGCPFPGMVAWECIHRPGCQRTGMCSPGSAEIRSGPLAVFGIRAYVCHPLIYRDRNIGILAFGTRTRPRFSEEDQDLMRAVADLVAVALARKQWEKELEQRVAERTAELTVANKELENFTYAASHDMRAPLGRICSFSALLGKKYRDILKGDGLTFLELIHQNATRLDILIEDLLTHARFGGQPLPAEEIEPWAAVQAILHERADDIRQKGTDISLDLPEGLQVSCNPLGLSQVLRNLVDNALKYSSHAAPPVVEIGGRQQEGRCRLWVRDNGIGLDMAHRESIFELFRRLHPYSEYPGSGIGLALVKRAVERMDGKVWVESEEGRGATFFVELPAGGPAG